ncbi:hypothetical protein [Nocardioides sp. SYSU DS0663]|uniref:hypothetical protein n=1 Tax=Nocardioides sp. SYSU DS0663 TaxID=3416445 RepID=UPI003F4B5FA9
MRESPRHGADGLDETVDAPGREPRPGPVRWWQRAVPVTGLGAIVLVAAVLTLPEREVELSTSRKPQPFVELFLTSRPDAACAGATATLRFRVVSHLERRRSIRYRVGVDPAGRRAETVRDRGRVRLAPGQARTVRVELPDPPSGAHDLTVRLRQRPELLRIHCTGTRR